MTETVILVDEKDRPIGYEEKISAHSNGGKLHRAFSIFVFNSKGEVLLQLRAKAKHHFRNLWTNPCCSHPRKGEELEQAAHRKLKQEFGFDTNLDEAFSFIYKATDPESKLTEHEFDHVFTGKFDGVPKPNPEEIDDWKWTTPTKLREDLEKHPDRYTPWFRIAFESLEKKGLVS
ncbi:isopentenyl-diphosphate Delta-isomerase [Candidatus Bathyarchaeota archaeon]|nr:MAG: isopentenyl-diphosphate delta-isomerase [archaeon 13_2_20CM_2_53_6]OLE58854.1 MAG: isopentenyl-diphosphate delta-isomerase [Crenarchaeota archaeon 13_1_20CM_2_53_14]TMI23965.1 MAG: isopentenyl-diphosphate Delta-isomerase [Candidatus Bathyarchaeota archaeon]TMI36879.1 MAG: isopentenyl-diphosphate Delta-isomerase [Candidatus Bathyarchaeota archaeon]